VIQTIKLLIIQFSLPPTTASLLGPNISPNIAPYSQNLSNFSFLRARDEVSHPYKIRDKIVVL
jgi:hypothetical protein